MSIDTAGSVCSAALSDSGRVLSMSVLDEPRAHASRLAPMIRDLTGETGISMSDLAAVAVSKGPGSYTGLRIGVSTAKGLCFGLGIPLIGVPTFRAVAAAHVGNVPGEKSALVTIAPSRRGEAYWQVWRRDAKNPEPLAAARSDEFDVVVAELGAVPGGKIVLGDVSEGLRRSLSETHLGAEILPDDAKRPTIEGIVRLGTEAFERSDFEDVVTFEPYYLKEFVAKQGGSPFDQLDSKTSC